MAGHQVELVSDFRSFEGRGDASAQGALRAQGAMIAAELISKWCHGPREAWPEVWLTYHLYYKAPDWLGPPVCRRLGIPYVVAEASCAPKRAQGPWSQSHAAVVDALQRADLLLCPTADDVPALRAVVRPQALVRRLPPFLDPAPYQLAAGARGSHRSRLAQIHSLDPSVPWMVVAAMMRPGDKSASYELLAQVLPLLADLRWHLLVAGDGSAGPAIRSLLEQAAPGRCRFAGECSGDALAAIYAAGDLCIWPAVNEAYGMAMLEAQAAGTVVVSCAVRGVPEVLVDGVTGLLAADGDVAGLAKHARRLLQDPARRSDMGEAAARFVAAERSTSGAALLLQELLALLCTGSAAAPVQAVAS